MRLRRRRERSALSTEELAAAWQVISLLLDYPDETLLARLPLVRSVVDRLPDEVRNPLSAFCVVLEEAEAAELRGDYVQTFDTSRRCCLYLSYFTHGDTRRRGMALLEFKQAYQAHGVDLDTAELPDHLSVVLEFGASYDVATTWRLLTEHRAGIEVLSRALAERGSPWRHVVAALLATLPPLAGDDEQRLLQLIRQGPPNEDVGLDSSTPYLIDPDVTGHLIASRAPAPGRPVSLDLGPTRLTDPVQPVRKADQ